MKKLLRRATALATAALFIFDSLGLYATAFAVVTPGVFVSEKTPATLNFDLPRDLGTIQSVVSGEGPVVFHLQTAHGNLEAQKNIQKILAYLHETFEVDRVFLEGVAYPINSENIRFFPEHMETTRRVLNVLAEEALVKGPELFLADNPSMPAQGIETLELYLENVRDFQAVLAKQKDTTEFVNQLDQQIKRLSAPYLNKDLRKFLESLDRYEEGLTPFKDHLRHLKNLALEYLRLDLRLPDHQIDWPMLFRLSVLEKITQEYNAQTFEREKDAFFAVIKKQGVLPDMQHELERMLARPLNDHGLPNPQTGIFFETLNEKLGPDFSYEDFPNVSLIIGHQILRSELDGMRVFEEIHSLEKKIAAQLAFTEKEHELIVLLEDYRLLKKLFALELTPTDYERVIERQEALTPGRILNRFLDFNHENRVRNMANVETEALRELFDLSVNFYDGAKNRDREMLKNVSHYIKQYNSQKVAVITGGFHSGPFEDYFRDNNFNYALISPHVSEASGREAYITSLFDFQSEITSSTSTLESVPFTALDWKALLDHGVSNPAKIKWHFLQRAFEEFLRDGIGSFEEFLELLPQSAFRNVEIKLAPGENQKTGFHAIFKNDRGAILGELWAEAVQYEVTQVTKRQIFGLGGERVLTRQVAIQTPEPAVRSEARKSKEEPTHGAKDLANAHRQLEEVAQRINLDPALLAMLKTPYRQVEVEIPVVMDDGSMKRFKGYRVYHNGARGPGKGGLRFHPAVDLEETTALATWMSLKNAIAGIPHGGGKGGIAVNPRELSEAELERLTRGFVRALLNEEARRKALPNNHPEKMKEGEHILGPFDDVPAPDVGTDNIVIAYFVDEYIKVMQEEGRIVDPLIEAALRNKQNEINEIEERKMQSIAKPDLWISHREAGETNWKQAAPRLYYYLERIQGENPGILETPEIAVATSKPEALGGSLGRTTATGLGVYFATREALLALGEDLGIGTTLKDQRVAVQGFGNVGGYAAKFIDADGAQIREVLAVAAKDFSKVIAIRNDQGLPVEAVSDHIAENPRAHDLLTFAEKNPKTAQSISEESFWSSTVDILIPAALGGSIGVTEANLIASKTKTDPVKLIVEGANGPIAGKEAEEILLTNGTVIVPDVVANAGGVIVSILEGRQNVDTEKWPQAYVERVMEDKLTSSFESVLRLARAEGVDLRTAANMIAVIRIINAELARNETLAKKYNQNNLPYKLTSDYEDIYPETIFELRGLTTKKSQTKLINDSERRQNRELREIADDVEDYLSTKRGNVLAIGGLEASGVEQVADRMQDILSEKEISTIIVSLDDNSLEAVSGLLNGETVSIRRNGSVMERSLGDDQILILEGTHALSVKAFKALGDEFQPGKVPDNIYPLFVHTFPDLLLEENLSLTSYDLRMLRDILASGDLIDQTIERWGDERLDQIKDVYPHIRHARRVFNTYLPYELPFLREHIWPLLKRAQVRLNKNPDSNRYVRRRVNRLVQIFEGIESWNLDQLPTTSLLWEFLELYASEEQRTEMDKKRKKSFQETILTGMQSLKLVRERKLVSAKNLKKLEDVSIDFSVDAIDRPMETVLQENGRWLISVNEILLEQPKTTGAWKESDIRKLIETKLAHLLAAHLDVIYFHEFLKTSERQPSVNPNLLVEAFVLMRNAKRMFDDTETSLRELNWFRQFIRVFSEDESIPAERKLAYQKLRDHSLPNESLLESVEQVIESTKHAGMKTDRQGKQSRALINQASTVYLQFESYFQAELERRLELSAVITGEVQSAVDPETARTLAQRLIDELYEVKSENAPDLLTFFFEFENFAPTGLKDTDFKARSEMRVGEFLDAINQGYDLRAGMKYRADPVAVIKEIVDNYDIIERIMKLVGFDAIKNIYRSDPVDFMVALAELSSEASKSPEISEEDIPDAIKDRLNNLELLFEYEPGYALNQFYIYSMLLNVNSLVRNQVFDYLKKGNGTIDINGILRDLGIQMRFYISSMVELNSAENIIKRLKLDPARVEIHSKEDFVTSLIKDRLPGLNIVVGPIKNEEAPMITFGDSPVARVRHNAPYALTLPYNPNKLLIPKRLSGEERNDLRRRFGIEDRKIIVVAPDISDRETLGILKYLKVRKNDDKAEKLTVVLTQKPNVMSIDTLRLQGYTVAVRRDRNEPDFNFESENADILILNSRGEVSKYMNLADAVYMGDRNAVEGLGAPFVFSAHQYEFNEGLRNIFTKAGVAITANDDNLAEALKELFENGDAYRANTERAVSIIEDEILNHYDFLNSLVIATAIFIQKYERSEIRQEEPTFFDDAVREFQEQETHQERWDRWGEQLAREWSDWLPEDVTVRLIDPKRSSIDEANPYDGRRLGVVFHERLPDGRAGPELLRQDFKGDLKPIYLRFRTDPKNPTWLDDIGLEGGIPSTAQHQLTGTEMFRGILWWLKKRGFKIGHPLINGRDAVFLERFRQYLIREGRLDEGDGIQTGYDPSTDVKYFLNLDHMQLAPDFQRSEVRNTIDFFDYGLTEDEQIQYLQEAWSDWLPEDVTLQYERTADGVPYDGRFIDGLRTLKVNFHEKNEDGTAGEVLTMDFQNIGKIPVYLTISISDRDVRVISQITAENGIPINEMKGPTSYEMFTGILKWLKKRGFQEALLYEINKPPFLQSVYERLIQQGLVTLSTENKSGPVHQKDRRFLFDLRYLFNSERSETREALEFRKELDEILLDKAYITRKIFGLITYYASSLMFKVDNIKLDGKEKPLARAVSEMNQVVESHMGFVQYFKAGALKEMPLIFTSGFQFLTSALKDQEKPFRLEAEARPYHVLDDQDKNIIENIMQEYSIYEGLYPLLSALQGAIQETLRKQESETLTPEDINALEVAKVQFVQAVHDLNNQNHIHIAMIELDLIKSRQKVLKDPQLLREKIKELLEHQIGGTLVDFHSALQNRAADKGYTFQVQNYIERVEEDLAFLDIFGNNQRGSSYFLATDNSIATSITRGRESEFKRHYTYTIERIFQDAEKNQIEDHVQTVRIFSGLFYALTDFQRKLTGIRDNQTEKSLISDLQFEILQNAYREVEDAYGMVLNNYLVSPPRSEARDSTGDRDRINDLLGDEAAVRRQVAALLNRVLRSDLAKIEYKEDMSISAQLDQAAQSLETLERDVQAFLGESEHLAIFIGFDGRLKGIRTSQDAELTEEYETIRLNHPERILNVEELRKIDQQLQVSGRLQAILDKIPAFKGFLTRMKKVYEQEGRLEDNLISQWAQFSEDFKFMTGNTVYQVDKIGTLLNDPEEVRRKVKYDITHHIGGKFEALEDVDNLLSTHVDAQELDHREHLRAALSHIQDIREYMDALVGRARQRELIFFEYFMNEAAEKDVTTASDVIITPKTDLYGKAFTDLEASGAEMPAQSRRLRPDEIEIINRYVNFEWIHTIFSQLENLLEAKFQESLASLSDNDSRLSDEKINELHLMINDLQQNVLVKSLELIRLGETRNEDVTREIIQIIENYDNRSELRAADLGENFERFFEGPRFMSLPLRIEIYGAKALVELLSTLLDRKVYSERAGILKPALKEHFKENLGEGRILATESFENLVNASLNQKGHLVLDAGWMEVLIDKSPRTLFILLTLAKKYYDKNQTPLFSVLGDDEFLKRVETSLLRKSDKRDSYLKNELNLNEQILLREELLPDLSRLMNFVSPADYPSLLEAEGHGVVALFSAEPENNELHSAGTFVLKPENVHEDEIVALALLTPTLLKGASLIRDLKTRGERIEKLRKVLPDIFPGARFENGLFRVDSLGQFIEAELIARKLVAVSA